MNNSHIGSIAETAVELDLMRSGFNVGRTSAPARYDRLVDVGGSRFVRLQVKTGHRLGGVIAVAYGDSHSYTADEVDFIAVYDPYDQAIYYVPIADVAECRKSFTLRLTPPTRFSANTRYAERYTKFPYESYQPPGETTEGRAAN